MQRTWRGILESKKHKSYCRRINRRFDLLDKPGSEAHRTSGARESMGRWRRDLAPDVQESCDATLGSALREFGYA